MNAATGRLLVVDDDENNRDMLSRRLRRRGFDVGVACDGRDALQSIDREDFDLVLLDVEMPGLSGFDVLRQLRLSHAATRLPIIIATARTDRNDIVEALGLGANDYVTKPIDFDVVVARVDTQLSHKRAVDRILALEADLRQRNQQLEQANTRMKRSLELAAAMQHSLLPVAAAPMPGIRFAWKFNPCDELGGDIFNVFPIGSRHVGVYLLDVSGHGVPAALLSVTLSRLLDPAPGHRSIVCTTGPDGVEPRPPNEVAGELNLRFPMDSRLGQYFTLFYGVLDVTTRQLRYVSAGHPPALLLAEGKPPAYLDAEGFAVGWFPEASFDEHTLNLAVGDRLVIYSDGVIETMSPTQEFFGKDRLTDACQSGRCVPLDGCLAHLMQSVDSFRSSAAVLDDVSALMIEPSDAAAPIVS
jgi:sigma-B regulation protein RsbU (phosphoserine phosphatase)